MVSRHRAWAEVDLDAFRHNLHTLRRLAGGAEVWPVLKANAYGHGAPAIARLCAREGVPRIGVGDSGEALELREAGIRIPLLILGTVIDAELPDLLHHEVEIGVHSESRVLRLGAAARQAGRKLGVHLKVDTGMARLGVMPAAALRVARAILAEPALELRGLMTHFSSPLGSADPRTAEQLRRLKEVLAEFREAGIPRPCVHCANSATLLTTPPLFGDAVRPGIALYGVAPPSLGRDLDLRPVLSLRAQVVFLKDLPAGAAVGYGGKWISPRPTRLAVLPIGYHDGLPYRLGAEGRGTALLRGHRCPIVGAISMDYCTVDVGHVEGVDVGDPATLIGRDGGERVSMHELAEAAGTIPYEISCSIGTRVHRVYSTTAAREGVSGG